MNYNEFRTKLDKLDEMIENCYRLKDYNNAGIHRKTRYSLKCSFHKTRIEFYMNEYQNAMENGTKSDLKNIGIQLRKSMRDLEGVSKYD